MDNQGSKIPFRDLRWVGPYIVQKALPKDNYVVRKINNNKTQILHRIRLRTFLPNKQTVDSYQNEKLQSDDGIIIPQDGLYTLTWETDFGNLKREHSDTVSAPLYGRPQSYTNELSKETKTTRIRVENIPNNPNANEVNDLSAQRDATNKDDVTLRNNETNEQRRVSGLSKRRQRKEKFRTRMNIKIKIMAKQTNRSKFR